MRTKVEGGDILISITADIGTIAIIPEYFQEAYINQHISLARSVSSISSKYIAWYLASPIGQKQLQDLQRGATKIGLGLDDIKSVNIPLPPLPEQNEIVAEIDRHLTIIDRLNYIVSKNLKRSVRTRQSILKKAFSGEIVPQDPDDEPASALIEKIKQASVVKHKKKSKKKTPKRKKKLKSKRIKRKLKDVMAEFPKGIKPEQLLSESGYSIDEIDDFYAELCKIADQIDQVKPKGEKALKWPDEAEITLHLRKN